MSINIKTVTKGGEMKVIYGKNVHKMEEISLFFQIKYQFVLLLKRYLQYMLIFHNLNEKKTKQAEKSLENLNGSIYFLCIFYSLYLGL